MDGPFSISRMLRGEDEVPRQRHENEAVISLASRGSRSTIPVRHIEAHMAVGWFLLCTPFRCKICVTSSGPRSGPELVGA